MRSMVAEMASNDAVPPCGVFRISGGEVRAITLVPDANDISVCAIRRAPAGQSPALRVQAPQTSQWSGVLAGIHF